MGMMTGPDCAVMCNLINTANTHKASWPWCSLFVGFPSLFFAPSGEQLALPICVLEGDNPVHHFPRFRQNIFLRAERFVVDVSTEWGSGRVPS